MTTAADGENKTLGVEEKYVEDGPTKYLENIWVTLQRKLVRKMQTKRHGVTQREMLKDSDRQKETDRQRQIYKRYTDRG